jgi:hypothetical protein
MSVRLREWKTRKGQKRKAWIVQLGPTIKTFENKQEATAYHEMMRPMLPQQHVSHVLWGAEAIGRAIGLSRSKAFYMLEAGHLKHCRKIGKHWVADSSNPKEILGFE